MGGSLILLQGLHRKGGKAGMLTITQSTVMSIISLNREEIGNMRCVLTVPDPQGEVLADRHILSDSSVHDFRPYCLCGLKRKGKKMHEMFDRCFIIYRSLSHPFLHLNLMTLPAGHSGRYYSPLCRRVHYT